MRTDRRVFLKKNGLFFLSSLLAFPKTSVTFAANSARPVRIASVKFGSLSWVLETIKAERLDKKYDLSVDVVETATNASSPIALYGGNADIIVSDWPWVLRQRNNGENLLFSPFSASLGAVVVPNNSAVKTLTDLKGKKLGVAGSATDKSWLLLRAYTKSKLGSDLSGWVIPQYGSAPLLNEQLKSGQLDAILNFWTYTARLEAEGYRAVLHVSEVLSDLGIVHHPALVGFIWKDTSDSQLRESIEKLLFAVQDANKLLAESLAPWSRLREQMKVSNDAEFQALIEGYRAGVRGFWTENDMRAAEKIVTILNKLDKNEFLGKDVPFDHKAFYVPQS